MEAKKADMDYMEDNTYRKHWCRQCRKSSRHMMRTKRPCVPVRIKTVNGKLCRQTLAFVLCGENDKGFGRGENLFETEDLNHTGSHKINNVLWSGASGKRKWVRSASLQRQEPVSMGVATATAAALIGLECEIFSGKKRIRTDRCSTAIEWSFLGAKVHPVTSGTMTLKLMPSTRPCASGRPGMEDTLWACWALSWGRTHFQ